jgi:hypothetical protein
MTISDLMNQMSKGVSYLSRIVGQPFLYRIIFPAMTLLGCALLPLAVNSLLQIDDDFTFGAGGWLWLLALFGALIFLFWAIDRGASGFLMKFILTLAQWRDLHAGTPLRETIEFIDNPDILKHNISRRKVNLEKEEESLKLARSQIASALNREKIRIAQANTKQLNLATLLPSVTRSAFHKFRLKRLQSRLQTADLQLKHFDELQESTGRSNIIAKALSDAAEAVARVSNLIGKMDELVRARISSGSSPDESTPNAAEADWRKEFDLAVELRRVIRDARTWRQKLIMSVSAVSELMSYLTRQELSFVLLNTDFRMLTGEREIDPDPQQHMSLRDIVVRASLLSNTTLASGITSSSTEEYWARRGSQISPHWRITPTILSRVSHVDLVRTKAVMYAALIVALIFGGPCIVIIGRLLFGEWGAGWLAMGIVPLAILLEVLISLLLRFVVWMTVVVGINERQLALCTSVP